MNGYLVDTSLISRIDDGLGTGGQSTYLIKALKGIHVNLGDPSKLIHSGLISKALDMWWMS